jgi:thioesterase domain-containing protein
MKPTLLLLAGMLNNDKVWQPVARGLSEQAEVRIVHFANQDSMSAMAAHAWQALADLPAHQPLALAGFSMGGFGHTARNRGQQPQPFKNHQGD